MIIEERFPLLEDILGEWKEIIGEDYEGYRNHLYRMVHFCFVLRECTNEEREKIIIAACFHDIGLWAGRTFDYLPSSISAAMVYLKSRGKEEWNVEVALMISEHHKLRKSRDDTYPLVEVFRQGDLVDFSLGLFKFEVRREFIKTVKATFPNAGFHQFLAKQAAKWFVKHPLNPAPMMKW